MIAHTEDDPAWDDHITWCDGCEICKIAVRMWKDDPKKPDGMLELWFLTRKDQTATPPDSSASTSPGNTTYRPSFSGSWLAVFVTIVGFIAIYWLGTKDFKQPTTFNTERGDVSKDEKFLEQLQANATKKHPDIQLSEAMRQEAIERATEKPTSEVDELKRTSTAAAMFWGFFFVNARERPEFCREQGVDIQPFVKAFERAHANEIAKARSIYARVPADEEKLYLSLKPQMRKAIVQDMNDIATSNKISIKEGCQMLSENADVLVQEWHLSKAPLMTSRS